MDRVTWVVWWGAGVSLILFGLAVAWALIAGGRQRLAAATRSYLVLLGVLAILTVLGAATVSVLGQELLGPILFLAGLAAVECVTRGMAISLRWRGLLGLACLVLSGLLWITLASPVPSNAELPLDAWTPSTLPGQPVECAAVQIDATLHGSAADPAIAWLVDAATDQRLQALWPHGYAARFDPGLVVIDVSGGVVLREGDRVTRACFTGLADTYWLDPPFRQ